MSKDMNLQSLFCGILFCISVAALVIACLAFTKKGGGKGEYYKDTPPPITATEVVNCINKSAIKGIQADSQSVFGRTFAYAMNDCTYALEPSPPPTPIPTPIPTPTSSPGPPWICSPDKGCNVCAECCQSRNIN